MFPFYLTCLVDLPDGGKLHRKAFYIVAIFLILNGLYSYAKLIPTERKCGQETLVFSPYFHFQPHQEECNAIEEVTKFLDKNNLRIAIAPYHDTLISFYSQKRVIGIGPRFSIFTVGTDTKALDLTTSAFVIYHDSAGERNLMHYIRAMKDIKVVSFDTLRVYYPLDPSVLRTAIEKKS